MAHIKGSRYTCKCSFWTASADPSQHDEDCPVRMGDRIEQLEQQLKWAEQHIAPGFSWERYAQWRN